MELNNGINCLLVNKMPTDGGKEKVRDMRNCERNDCATCGWNAEEYRRRQKSDVLVKLRQKQIRGINFRIHYKEYKITNKDVWGFKECKRSL